MASILDFVYDDTEEEVDKEEKVISTEDGTGSSSNVVPISSIKDFVYDDTEDNVSSVETDEILEEEYIEPTMDDVLDAESMVADKPISSIKDFVYDDMEGTGVKYKEPDVNLYNAEFFELDVVQNSISTYLTARDGKSGARQEDESKEEYAERYFTHMRWLESNLYKTGKGITWLGKADDAAKGNFAYLYTAYKKMPGAFSPGGGDAFSAVQDYIYASVLDPVNVVTLGSAMALKVVGGRMAGKVLLSTALRNAVPRIALAGSVDTLMGAVQEASIQTVEQRAEGTKDGKFIDMRDEKDWKLITAMGLVNGTIGTGLNLLALRQGARNTDYAGSLRSELDDIRTDLDPNSATANNSAQNGAVSTVDGVGRGGTIYDPVRAQGLMDDNIERTGIAGGIIDSEVSEEVIRSAGKLIELIPDIRAVDDSELLSDVIMDVVATVMQPKELDKLSPHLIGVTVRVGDDEIPFEDLLRLSVDSLQDRIKKEGISQEEYAQMMRLSVGEGGRTIGAYSHAARGINKALKLTKAEQDMLDPSKGEDMISYGFFKSLGMGIMSWDRARRAILTSMPITTLRNIGGASGYLSMESASTLLAQSMLATGRGLRAASEGRFSVKGTTDGVKDVVKNSFSLFGKMLSYGDNRALSELILKDHSRLANTLLRTTNEAGENELGKIVRGVNALNIAQDQYIRSGVFVDSIERQLRTYGMDAKKILSQGKQIPAPVVKKAVDDALTATFSAPAKNAVAKNLLGLVEKLPFIATAEFPFMRFMMNAVHFQYKYSFLNTFSTTSKYFKYKDLLANNNPAAKRAGEEAAQDLGRTVVGTSMLVAAIKYRSEHQDTSLLIMENEGGEQVNVSALFPLPAYLAVGDLFYKAYAGLESDEATPTIDWRDFSQAVLGLQKAPFSDAARFLSDFSGLSSADEVSMERMGETAGKFVGGLVGQATTPLKFVKQVLTAFDDEESIIRDPNWVEGDGFWERAMNRSITEVQRNVPVLSQSLPARYSATRPGPMRSDFAPASQLTGLLTDVAPNEVEAELEKFGYKKYFITARSGNRIMDAVIKKHMSGPLNMFMEDMMNLSEYSGLSRSDKKEKIDGAISAAKKLATILADEELHGISTTRGYSIQQKAGWESLTAKERGRVDARYKELKAEYPQMIPDGGSVDSTIQQDERWAVGTNLSKDVN